MQKTSILCFTIIITFAKSTAGAVIPRNTHLADFRGFGANGCVEQNLGVWTIIDTDIQPGECKGFNGETVKALTLSDLNDGCKMVLYTDSQCQSDGRLVEKTRCQDAEGEWKAWTIECV